MKTTQPDARLQDRVFRLALTVLIMATIVWLGACIMRFIVWSELLKPGILQYEDYIAPEAEREIYRLLSMVSAYAIGGYVLVIMSSAVVLATSPLRMREHGWLMLSAILLYLFVPIEVYTAYLDLKMIYLEFYTAEARAAFRELVLARVGALAGVPFIAQLCYISILGIVVFQPFRKRSVIAS
jgi:hypothetical protein